MGTNSAPLVADLFLFCYEKEFMKSLSRKKNKKTKKKTRLTLLRLSIPLSDTLTTN